MTENRGQESGEIEKPMDWDDYDRLRRDLDALRISQTNSYDRAVISLSSGGIGLSLLVLANDNIRVPLAHSSLIFVSWIAFVLSILLNVTSHYSGARTAGEEIESLDREMRGEQPIARRWRLGYHYTKLATGVSGITFIMGVICLLLFAYFNIVGANYVKTTHL